jgi:hypothetical protein
MKLYKFLLATIAAFLLAFTVKLTTTGASSPSPVKSNFKKTIVSCGPDWATLKKLVEEFDIPPIPGAGTYKWKISTANDSAQFYFNQGINMYYGFHIIEAIASFKKAERFDDRCAMIYWAQALCYGPNINDFGYRTSPDALTAVKNAMLYSPKSTKLEQALIDAMKVRYTADSTDVTRTKLNQDYTDRMKKVSLMFPENADALTLYADAMMLQHPWDLWFTNGKPKPWTPAIQSLLEKILAKHSLHPGANHYYIHVMEPSPFAAKALPSAERLGKTNPGLSHLVHMPSHIYLRTGNYQKGVQVNKDAVNSYKNNLLLYAPTAGADFLYLIHNLHMKTNNAMLAANYNEAAQAAAETVNNIPPDYYQAPPPMGNYVQYIAMTPVFVQIRFSKWQELLAMKKPANEQVYATIIYHFGRGFAFAATKQPEKAGIELDALRALMKDSSLYVPFIPFSPAIDGARVAEQMLLGIIHFERNMPEGAIRHFSMADSIEAAMVYNEPRDWLINPKQLLGHAYIQGNNADGANKFFSADLLYNKDNYWSMLGLYKALKLQNKNATADLLLKKIKKLFPWQNVD